LCAPERASQQSRSDRLTERPSKVVARRRRGDPTSPLSHFDSTARASRLAAAWRLHIARAAPSHEAHLPRSRSCPRRTSRRRRCGGAGEGGGPRRLGLLKILAKETRLAVTRRVRTTRLIAQVSVSCRLLSATLLRRYFRPLGDREALAPIFGERALGQA
jgi:hypothetical protein